MFCKHCGSEIFDGAMFCSKCGKKIQENSLGNAGRNGNSLSDSGPWYYISEGEKRGPLSLTETKEAIKAGKILSSTLVWTNGFSAWMSAHTTELNEYIINEVPAINPASISDKWAWALATIPLFANIILSNIGVEEPILTIIVIALNCVFYIKDTNYLKKEYTDPGKWVYLGLVLVPVYLFIRAAKTNKKYAYAIVWCVMFVLIL